MASAAFTTTAIDTASFPSSIGTWSTPSGTTLTLTFNSKYTFSLMPNFSGCVYWYNGVLYKANPLPPPGLSGNNPNTTFTWNGTNWVMVYVINGTTFSSGTSDSSSYGFFMYLNILN